ncbi:CPCC family cysteine-rich protein [Chloroflexota bacterium]
MSNLFPCPCCGFMVFDEPAGCFEICGICNWQDDPVQLEYPGMHSGANRASLKECQDRILIIFPLKIMQHEGIKRDIHWRPLRVEECIIQNKNKGSGINYFNAVIENDPPSVYWK